MNIEWLREFLILSRVLNYRLAAESLFITQSTLSKHIRSLENKLDTQLFLRNTKSCSLTESGKIFREHAEIIVREYDLALERLSDNHAIRGLLKIGGSVRFPLINKILCDATAAFETKYPDVNISVEDIQWEDYRTRLLSNVDDVVLSIHLPNMLEEGLEIYDIDQVPLCAWVSENNHRFNENEVLTFETLSSMPMRILNSQKSQCFTSYLRSLFERRGLPIRLGKPLNQSFAIGPNDFAITPKFSAKESLGATARMHNIEGDEMVQVALVRKKHISNPLAALFFEEFKSIVAPRNH